LKLDQPTSFFPTQGVFGMLMLYDTQRVITNAKTKEVYDPMSESIAIYLNTINIFVRMVTIMAGSQQNRRK
jgi:FtsH-binding integral membrane protein